MRRTNPSVTAIIAVLVVCVVTSQSIAQPGEAPSADIEREVCVLVKRLRCEALREAARTKPQEIQRRGETVAHREALYFLHDVHAAETLLLLLSSWATESSSIVSEHCMAVLELPSLQRLYEIAEPLILEEDEEPSWSGAVQVSRERFAKRLSERAATILQVKPPKFRTYWTTDKWTTKKILREWWLQVLRESKGKPGKRLTLFPTRPMRGVKEVQASATAFEKSLLSKQVRELVKTKLKEFGNDDARVQRQAVYFFADLRARPVLLAALASGDWDLQSVAADECMDVFRHEDLSALYGIVLEASLDSAEHRPDDVDRRKRFVTAICQGAASILQIKLPPPQGSPKTLFAHGGKKRLNSTTRSRLPRRLSIGSCGGLRRNLRSKSALTCPDVLEMRLRGRSCVDRHAGIPT